MSAAALNKLSGASLQEVLKRSQLPPEALERIAGLGTIEAVFAALAQAGFGIEATRVLAHALPKREAVWWACMCAAHTAPPDLPEADRKVRELAESWVRQQSMETARAAMDEAKRTGFQSPEAWAGVGAFWSGDSLAPPDSPAVPPPPHLTGVAVAGAVALASVRLDAARQPRRLAMFLQSAQDIAAGGPGRLPAEES
ncbi:MAG: hypothetical protein KGQ79_10120 [Proteobacteria bacterium]|nr:hypothetical protein [Pseudomonadota bacterium]MBU6424723.1 hypothetical protein [Rhodospirillales bacterium]